MREHTTRKTTKYSFLIGTALITAAILLIIVGLFVGIVTAGNVEGILWALLISAASFFGLTIARAGAAEVATITAATQAAITTPSSETVVTSPSSQVEITQDNWEDDDEEETPPAMEMPENQRR